ncbi:hypothetical protein GY45DRAFT_734680 [Cubamyces sp. BRFM 1775]|nr:hypothetical protein GY45DRAFT_734680 [Cubamyces sp. BRFM 1775]
MGLNAHAPSATAPRSRARLVRRLAHARSLQQLPGPLIAKGQKNLREVINILNEGREFIPKDESKTFFESHDYYQGLGRRLKEEQEEARGSLLVLRLRKRSVAFEEGTAQLRESAQSSSDMHRAQYLRPYTPSIRSLSAEYEIIEVPVSPTLQSTETAEAPPEGPASSPISNPLAIVARESVADIANGAAESINECAFVEILERIEEEGETCRESIPLQTVNVINEP